MKPAEAHAVAATLGGWLYTSISHGRRELPLKVVDVLPLTPNVVDGVDFGGGATLVLASGLRLVVRVEPVQESIDKATGWQARATGGGSQ